MSLEIGKTLEQSAVSNGDCRATLAKLQADSSLGVARQEIARPTDTAQSHLPACTVVENDLSQQISNHEKQDRSRSYLARISDLFYKDDNTKLKKLVTDQADIKREHQEGRPVDLQQMQQVKKDIADDKHAVDVKNTVAGVVGGVATISTMFVPGPAGLALSTTANALDEANPQDAAPVQLGEFALGGAKGVVKKFAASQISELPVSTATQGILQGEAQRVTDTFMDHKTYINPETDSVDLQQAGPIISDKVIKQSINPTALATDAIARMGGDALGKPVGAAVSNLAGEAVSQKVGDVAGKAISGLATDAAKGAATGFAIGTIREAAHEIDAHNFSPVDVLANGTKLGGEIAVASVVGGSVKQTAPVDFTAWKPADTAMPSADQKQA